MLAYDDLIDQAPAEYRDAIGQEWKLYDDIQENAKNAMVQELLTCGLKGEVCDPGGLPKDVDAKRAVVLYLARTDAVFSLTTFDNP